MFVSWRFALQANAARPIGVAPSWPRKRNRLEKKVLAVATEIFCVFLAFPCVFLHFCIFWHFLAFFCVFSWHYLAFSCIFSSFSWHFLVFSCIFLRFLAFPAFSCVFSLKMQWRRLSDMLNTWPFKNTLAY
jgi:hypothetical protein